MTTRTDRWCWIWRGWRASTWLFLLWSALLWPEIVSVPASDAFLAEAGVAVLVVPWLLGAIVLTVARGLSDRWRGHVRLNGGRAETAVRTVLPFLAAGYLAILVVDAIVTAASSAEPTPTAIELAVADEWRGENLTVSFGAIGGGEPITSTGPVAATEVTCRETERTLAGAPVHACAIVHCDVAEAGFLNCPDTISPACAALVGGRLVLVSPTWTAGPERLREDLAATGVPGCRR